MHSSCQVSSTLFFLCLVDNAYVIATCGNNIAYIFTVATT